MTNATFTCSCHGSTRLIDESHVEHDCRLKGEAGYYDGQEHYAPYRRVQINPSLTGGVVKFNWFKDWD